MILAVAGAAGQVSAHLEYATTTHRAQGITTDHAHVLAAAGMAREPLRRRDPTKPGQANHAYVATDDVDPDCDHLPAPPSPAAGTAILATSGTELSATQTITANHNAAESLAHLEPIRQTLLTDAAHRHWNAALAATQLEPGVVDAIMASPHRDAFRTVPNHGATHGHLMDVVIDSVLEREGAAALGVDIKAPDAAARLASNLTESLSTHTEDPYRTPTASEPVVNPCDPAAPVIDELEGLIRTRVNTLADLAIATRPSWTHEHGPNPPPRRPPRVES